MAALLAPDSVVSLGVSGFGVAAFVHYTVPSAHSQTAFVLLSHLTITGSRRHIGAAGGTDNF